MTTRSCVVLLDGARPADGRGVSGSIAARIQPTQIGSLEWLTAGTLDGQAQGVVRKGYADTPP